MKIWSVKCGAQITAHRGTEWALRDPLRSTYALADPGAGTSSPAPLSTRSSPSPPKAPILREPGSRNRGGRPRYLSDLDAVSGPPKPQFPPPQGPCRL